MIFSSYDEELNYRFYEDWVKFWLPIYHKQILEAKFESNNAALKEIKMNILKNKSLKEYQEYIFEKLGINYLKMNEKEDLFLRNEKLIYLALKRKGLLHKQDELYDVGLIGLTKAINTYDENKGFKESTYFYKCIMNHFNQYFYLQNMSKRKCPTSIISLDYEFEENGGESYANIVPDPNVDIEQEIITQEKNEKLVLAISKLKPSYQEVIKRYYGIGANSNNLTELSKELGITREAINQKRHRALKQLKVILSKDYERE